MKIFALVGKSASGKSSIEKVLYNEGYNKIISTTTRPIRQNEVNGVDYYYISKEEFDKKLQNNDFIEHTEYNGWVYGINKKDIDVNKNYYMGVVEPNGYKQLQNYFGKKNVIGIYIYSNDKERLMRSLTREDNPNCKEICRRFISDIELFKDIESNAQYKIENISFSETVIGIRKIMGAEIELASIMDILIKL